jgi:Flp pilus assembly protein TadG
MFLLGVIWFGRAFNIYSTIQQAAQQGALAAARPTCSTCTPTFGGTAAVDTAVTAVMTASSIDPTKIVNPGAGTAPCTTSAKNITVCQQVELNSDPVTSPPTACPSLTPPTPTPSQICGILVTFQYPYQFYLPFTSLNMSTITLTAKAQTRMEN